MSTQANNLNTNVESNIETPLGDVSKGSWPYMTVQHLGSVPVRVQVRGAPFDQGAIVALSFDQELPLPGPSGTLYSCEI